MYQKILVAGSHSLTMPHNPAFNDVVAKTIAFATQIQQRKSAEKCNF